MKDDTISRHVAIANMNKVIMFRTNPEWKDRVAAYLKSLPSAQPEIIRCKDCGKRDPFWGSCSEYDDVMMPPEHFCGFAVKRVDNG